MQWRRSGLIVITIAVLATGCRDQPQTATSRAVPTMAGQSRTYTSVLFGFSIEYPPEWVEVPVPEGAGASFGPHLGDGTGAVAAMPVLAEGEYGGQRVAELDLEEYAKIALDVTEGPPGKYELASIEEIKGADGSPGYMTIWEPVDESGRQPVRAAFFGLDRRVGGQFFRALHVVAGPAVPDEVFRTMVSSVRLEKSGDES